MATPAGKSHTVTVEKGETLSSVARKFGLKVDQLKDSTDGVLTAKRKNILLLRDENGIKKQYRIDLTNINFINSPVYYLSQNDIIYIESNQAKINSSNVTGSSSILVAIASLVITTVNIITK